jgi:hypothetical protein
MAMRMIRWVLLLLSFNAYAGPYAELGIGGSVDSCIYESWQRTNGVTTINCSSSPLGYIAAGYQYKNFSISAEHMSSLTEKDKGLNVILIKYRIGQ